MRTRWDFALAHTVAKGRKLAEAERKPYYVCAFQRDPETLRAVDTEPTTPRWEVHFTCRPIPEDLLRRS